MDHMKTKNFSSDNYVQKLNPKVIGDFEDDLFRFDIVSTLHDPSKRQILNLFLKKDLPKLPSYYERYVLKHDEDCDVSANTDFVLARNLGGELKRVNFDLDLESTFLRRPRLSALGSLYQTRDSQKRRWLFGLKFMEYGSTIVNFESFQ